MTTTTVSEEVKELLFEDPDFESTLKLLASEFGPEATLQKVNKVFQSNRTVPEKEINGHKYRAGYKGPNMVPEGFHKGTLIDITQNGPNCKLLFVMDATHNKSPNYKGVFLYHNMPKDSLKVEHIVKLSKFINDDFAVRVKHETIPQTGDKHAVVERVEGLDTVLNKG